MAPYCGLRFERANKCRVNTKKARFLAILTVIFINDEQKVVFLCDGVFAYP